MIGMEQIGFDNDAAREMPAVHEVDGGFPFKGTCVEDGTVKEIGGSLQWRALVPDADEAPDMEFITFMFMNMDPDNPMEDVASDYPRAIESRIGFDFLDHLKESCDHETECRLLAMHLNGRPGYSERFDVSPARRDP